MSFRKLTVLEQLRNERTRNAQLQTKVQEQEDAILELAQIISEVQNGETILTQDK